MEVSWSELKSFVENRLLSIQWVELNNKYFLHAYDGPFVLTCELAKTDPAHLDQEDFENNFKTSGNKSFSDNNGIPIQRLKIAEVGSKFKTHYIYFKTSDLDSLKERKEDGTSYGYSTFKLYDINGVQITDSANETNAVKTVIEFEPNFTYEIIGGGIYQASVPASSVVAYAVFAPTIPEAYGGQVHFLNEAHMEMMGTGKVIDVDGYVPKKITYDSVNHSGRFNFIFHHNAGYQHELLMFVKIFVP